MNAPPRRGIDEMPDLYMLVGDTTEIELGEYFALNSACVENSRNRGKDVFEVTSSDSAAVAVSLAYLTTLEIVALELADSVRVTVASIDYDLYGLEFVVRVWAPR
ncbi:MAG: hypothetical protein J4F34_09240 [Gemmatimonadetes bacterium]|nr:hypothetical protein [Gemmatimonadota bacterium]